MNKKMKGGAKESMISEIFNAMLCYWWLLAIFFISIMVGIVYIVYKLNVFNIGKKYPYKSGLVVAIIGLFLACTYAFIYYMNVKDNINGKCDNYANSSTINKEFGNYILKFFFLLGTISLIIGFIYFMYWLVDHSNNLDKLIYNIFIFFSVIIGLAIVYAIFEAFITSSSKTASGTTKTNFQTFMTQLIFFIPCLLIEFIKYIEHQFNITTKPVWILLLLELVLIVLYFLFPIVLKDVVLHEGKEILKGPIYINNETNLGNYQNLTMSKKINYNYNYGLSFFLYINPQPTNTSAAYGKYTSLFNYANKPNILYNAKKNILKVVFQNNKKDLVNVYEMKNISYQKWMHFVINYNSGNVDIFIDNNLVVSHSGIAPYMTLDKITAGARHGINGGIKNVNYFNKIIPKSKLMLLFHSK